MRTPEQFAIEHAEYMAKAAERFISAVDYLGEQVHNECSDEYALDAVLHAAVKQKRRAVVDCGEAGHDDGRCGNASCLGA